MQNQCRFCKLVFQTDDASNHVCNDCRQEVKDTINKDERMKLDFLEVILKDQIAIERIAKQIFEVPVRNIGIGGEGSIAEFLTYKSKNKGK